ncbi:MAG: response regulator receiver domain [Pyrinomonadaceae bacterium]
MSALTDFSREAARQFLQSVVFVDDEIYAKQAGTPVEVTTSLPRLKSPFPPGEGEAQQPAQPVDVKTVAKVAAPEDRPAYHPKQLVESFARKGMVCALYEPNNGFAAGKDSELFRLCDRADIVILDWDLFDEDGRNITPLLKNLADAGQSSVPHHVRLCVVYTTKPDLERVANHIFQALDGQTVNEVKVEDETTIIKGATRVVVLGKPNISGRSAVSKAREVSEADLADRVIDEFAKMNSGMLASYALHGIAAIRRSTKRIVDKFSSDMDGPFILNRALTLVSDDAFDQLPELIAEEVLAVVQDSQILQSAMNALAADGASKIDLNPATFDWPVKDGRQKPQPPQLAKRFLAGGRSSIKEECSRKQLDEIHKSEWIERFHDAMKCAVSQGDKRLASLYNVRTRYANEGSAPALGFGTIVRYKGHQQTDWAYAFCLMPMCDGIRLDGGAAAKATAFPLWNLDASVNAGNGRGIVVELEKGRFQRLVASGKPRDRLWMAQFKADDSGTVRALKVDNTFVFRGEQDFEWVAQAKPAHAQRIASDVGQKLSRVGLAEAEWLRLLDRSGD